MDEQELIEGSVQTEVDEPKLEVFPEIPEPAAITTDSAEVRPRTEETSNGNREEPRSNIVNRSRSRSAKKPATYTRFVAIAWSGEREPANDLLWAEAVVDGEWVVIETLERIRTRREVVERILGLKSGLVTLDFNFSFPKQFFEFLSSEGIPDWRLMVRTIREDVKKNLDDGARLWLERMGRYRESFLDESQPIRRFSHDRKDRGWNFDKKESSKPYELQSRAERFRRTDLPLLPLAGASVMSTLQLGYNRLTERYEFNGNHRGRNSLLGMAMLGQLLDSGREDLSMWPFSELKRLAIVETLPWMFTEGKKLNVKDLTASLANYEDAGWEIPEEVIRIATANPQAQQTLFTLLGMIKSERRMLRNRFPIRFYSPRMYTDSQVQLEGWTYGINYRVPDVGRENDSTSESES